MNAPIPEFSRPPVSEVAVSAIFPSLENWRSAHAGVYWSRIIQKYPLTEVRMPLPYQIETFDDEIRPTSAIKIELPTPDVQRYWFLTDPPIRLIQVQRDRFAINWRKIKGDEIYPRYKNDIRPRFEEEWKTFVAFLAEHKIGEPSVQQCEITYVNDILRGDDWNDREDLRALFSPWWAKGTDGFLPLPETLRIAGSFTMPEQGGRLHFTAQRVLRAIDNRDALQLQLIARGRPKSSKLEDILSWMDLGHEWVVRGFADLTSPHAHKLWGRTQ